MYVFILYKYKLTDNNCIYTIIILHKKTDIIIIDYRYMSYYFFWTHNIRLILYTSIKF